MPDNSKYGCEKEGCSSSAIYYCYSIEDHDLDIVCFCCEDHLTEDAKNNPHLIRVEYIAY